MSKNINKPIWSEEQVNTVKKYLQSDEGKRQMKEVLEKTSKMEKTIDSMMFSWEEWAKIKDIPYTI